MSITKTSWLSQRHHDCLWSCFIIINYWFSICTVSGDIWHWGNLSPKLIGVCALGKRHQGLGRIPWLYIPKHTIEIQVKYLYSHTCRWSLVVVVVVRGWVSIVNPVSSSTIVQCSEHLCMGRFGDVQHWTSCVHQVWDACVVFNRLCVRPRYDVKVPTYLRCLLILLLKY